MLRYHKQVYTESEHLNALHILTERLNGLKWTVSEHCLDNIRYRVIGIEDILRFIKGVELKFENIFEYYLTDTGEPEKICYRVNYSEDIDLILVVSNIKNLITIYINSADDNHETLQKELYIKG